jgi:hypothetical protein
MSTVKKNAACDVLTAWSSPVRLTGETGPAGEPGEAGENAPSAAISVTSQVFRAKPGEPYSPTNILLAITAYNVVVTTRQWQYWSGSAWADISGATGASHTVYPGDFTDSRTYRCLINSSIPSDSVTISKFLSGLINELDLSTWIAGGTMPPAGWNIHGLAEENSFVTGYDHDGFSTILWRCQSDGGVDADGGFTVDFTADPTKTYRLIVYMRKGTNDGTTSFGCHSAYTENLDGSANSDPYFWTGSLPDDRDCIIIGIIHPAGYTGGDLEIAGLYDAATGEKLEAGTEFRMASGTPVQQIRVFLDECSTSGIIQDLWAPRVEEINGKEDSISAIYKRFAFDLSLSSAFINTLVGTDAFFDSVSARILKISGELFAASGQFGGISSFSIWMGAQAFTASDSTFADWWEANVAPITTTPVEYPVSGYFQASPHHYILSVEAYRVGSTRKFNFTTYDDESHTGYHEYNAVTSLAWAWVLTGVYQDIQVAAPLCIRNSLWFGDDTKISSDGDGIFTFYYPSPNAYTEISLFGGVHIKGTGHTGIYFHYDVADTYIFSVEKTGYTYPTIWVSYDALAFKNTIVPQSSTGSFRLGTTSLPWYKAQIKYGLYFGTTETEAAFYYDGTYMRYAGTKPFYITSTCPTTYIYSASIYLGYTSGTTIYLRGNQLTHSAGTIIDADGYVYRAVFN